MVISFKLETDDNLLYSKCTGSLSKYGQSLVIGNLLQTRKREVMFVDKDEDGEYRHVWHRLEDHNRGGTKTVGTIEEAFIPLVAELHRRWARK